jgi:regulator of cell morphogenesis and NO signaling
MLYVAGMLDPKTPVATLVLDHSELAPVFARHRIDYCCKGNKPLAEACNDLGLDVNALMTELEIAVNARSPRHDIDPRLLSLKELIVRRIAPHHQYLHRTMPFLRTLAAKVARVHGRHEPSLVDVFLQVDALCEVLADHLAEEEQILFPALIAGRAADVRTQLAAMRAEHEQVGEMLATLRRTARDYRPPEWACNSYRTLMNELAVLEADTLQHVHLENHVLLPRATS